jgi:hypothetical protein
MKALPANGPSLQEILLLGMQHYTFRGMQQYVGRQVDLRGDK